MAEIVSFGIGCSGIGWLEVDKSWEYSKMKGTAVFGIAVPFPWEKGQVCDCAL